jgi:hypothetical protein
MTGRQYIRALGAWAAVVALCVTAAGKAQAKQVRLEVNMDCLNTTEAGEDEVYVLLIGRTSDGREVKARLPNDRPGEEAGQRMRKFPCVAPLAVGRFWRTST